MADRRRTRRILVVDDSDVHRGVVTGILADAGYQVLEATDGVRGIAAAIEHLPHLVISDVVMPDLSGYQLCRFLKNDRRTVRIPIILMTATELARQHRFWGMRSGADRYVAKEAVTDSLLAEVADLLEHAPRWRGWDQAPAQTGAAPRSDRSITEEVARLLDRLLLKTTIAHETRHVATHVHDVAKCCAELAALAGDLVDFRCWSVHLLDSAGGRLHVQAHQPLSPAQLRVVRQTAADHVGGDDRLDEAEDTIQPPVAELVDEQLAAEGFAAVCSHPLKVHLDCVGSVSAFFDRRDALTPQVEECVSLLAQEFTPVARLRIMYQENERLSVSDGLTAVYNVRHLRQRLDEAYEHHERYKRPFSVMMLDVDHFKQINDQHGHPAGDSVLQGVADLLRQSVRRGDVLGRYGGDEFCLILPETTGQGASVLGERLRSTIEGSCFGDGAEALRVTSSIGVAEVAEQHEDGSAVLADADTALYQSKLAGRNKLTVFGGS